MEKQETGPQVWITESYFRDLIRRGLMPDDGVSVVEGYHFMVSVVKTQGRRKLVTGTYGAIANMADDIEYQIGDWMDVDPSTSRSYKKMLAGIRPLLDQRA